MSLKFRYPSKEQIPTEHAALYVERDGSFVLDVEGAVARERLDEFRTNNINLQNQIKAFEGIDVEKAKELLQKQKDLEDATLIKSGDLGKIIEKQLSPIKAELDKERGRANQLQSQLEAFTLTTSLQAVGAKTGVRATALTDLQARAARVFKVVDGKIVAFDADGQIKPGKDGYTPLTLDEWVEELRSEASHLFESNTGGGAFGNGSGGVGQLNHGRNPWKQETWNLTEQSKLARTNPTLAAQLKKAAGR
jgi:hypothetical protein